jgi:hypothetical protein
MKLFTVKIGSHLHGFATEQSDEDFVTVYRESLSTVLSLDYKLTKLVNREKEDHVQYELRHFCSLLLKNNPTALEVMKSDLIVSMTDDGLELRNNLDKFLDDDNAYAAFYGYVKSTLSGCDNEDIKMERRGKQLLSVLRVLEQGTDLLGTRDFEARCRTVPREDALNLKRGDKETFDFYRQLTNVRFTTFFETFGVYAADNRKIMASDRDWVNNFIYRTYAKDHYDG